MSLKSALEKMHEQLAEVEVEARKLKNQHLADILASASGKLHNAIGHPDVDLVGKEDEDHVEGKPFPFASFLNAAGDPWKEGDGQKFDVDRRPVNVDLNRDGTLQRAPNAFSHEDKRV